MKQQEGATQLQNTQTSLKTTSCAGSDRAAARIAGKTCRQDRVTSLDSSPRPWEAADGPVF